jgi:putative flavoprotein involved in K+ transport
VPGQTVIVGAGPAGLAVAAMLGRRGVPYTVLERGDAVGASWRSRYDSLRLHTVRWLSALPAASIPRPYGAWVRRDDLVAYLSDYAQRFGIKPELGIQVRRIQRGPAGWVLETSDGTREAERVVLATGYCNAPVVPDWPGLGTFPGPLCHSADYREPSRYRDRRVLVVGAGNSAAEIAVDLAGVGAEVQLSVRTPPNIVRRDTFGVPSQLFGIVLRRLPERVNNPVGTVLRRLTVPDLSSYGLPAPVDGFSQFLRSQTVPILDHGFVAALRQGRITVVPAVESVHEQDVRLAGGTVVRPEAIIAATGYRPDLGGLVGHLGVLDQLGQPRVRGARTLAEAPGLYFVGISVVLAGLIREIAREATEVARRLAQGSLGAAH